MTAPGYPDGPQPAFMTPEGTGSSGVCVVGEALGAEEAKPIGLRTAQALGFGPYNSETRLPFRPHAEAGSVLERALRLIPGLNRSQLLITNIVWYQPPNNWLEHAPYEREAIAYCRPMNEKLFRETQPRCLLALGNVALRELTGIGGHKQGILLTRGFPIPSKYGIPCVGSYHPSYLRRGAKDEEKESGVRLAGAAGRGMDLLGVLKHDIEVALHIGKTGKWYYEPESAVEYMENATLSDLANFYMDALNHPDLPIAWDIETRDTLSVDEEGETVVNRFAEVYQLQFSLRKKQAIIIDVQESEAFFKLVCKIMALPNIKLDFNGRSMDRPVAKQFWKDKGYTLDIAGDCHDLMDMWHHAQPDLPKGLQHVASFFCPEIGPWKHLDTIRPHFYGGRDVDPLHRIWEKLPGDLKKMGIWRGYEQHVFKLSRTFDKMQERGIPVNDVERRAFGVWLDEQQVKMREEMQAEVPEEIKGLHPKDGYKRIPVDLKQALLAHQGDRPTSIRVGEKLYVQHCFNDLDQLKLIDIPTYRWCQQLDFNPNSGDQVKAYIKLKREQEIAAYMSKGHSRQKAEEKAKYKIPHNRKEQRDTTDKKELLALGKRTGDGLFARIVQVREFGKLKGTYVDGWAPDEEGRVHPFFHSGPATGQIGSEDPNAQNVVSEKSRGAAASSTLIELAARFRRLIEAPPGYTLIECVAPATRILRRDLTWQSAGTLAAGDKIVGFDEMPVCRPTKKRAGRYLRTSTVKSVRRLMKPCLRITTDKGEVICSADHYWLKRTAGVAKWRRADTLHIGQKICFFVKPWEVEHSWESGYLAGFLDGEGSTNRDLQFGQNEGCVADLATDLICTRGFKVYKRETRRKCKQYDIGGDAFAWLRLLGMIRPSRLLEKAKEDVEDMAYWGKSSESARIIKIEQLGECEVVAIATTTGTFIAEGMLSHNCDYKSFHALTLGFCAEDASYMRLARLDIHSYFAAVGLLKIANGDKLLAMPDDELMEYLSWVKKTHPIVRDGQAKPAILGYGLGMRGQTLWEQNPDSFSGRVEAESVLHKLDLTFDKCAKWRKWIMNLANSQKFLTTPHGYIRRFWDVFTNKPVKESYMERPGERLFMSKDGTRWKVGHGTDAEAAVSLLVQNAGHGHLKENMLAIDDKGWAEKFGLINTVHDALWFCCPKPHADECVVEVKKQMELPSLVLKNSVAPDGLWCAVDATIGQNMQKREKFKLAA